MAKTARKTRSPFAPIDDAIEAIRDGKMIIVVDDEDRENEGDLTIAAEKITPEVINFMATHGRGLICIPMTEERLAELDMPPMVTQNTTRFETAFHVTIDAKQADEHRHLRHRPRGDRARRDRSADAAVGSGASRPHVAAQGP